MDNDELEKRIKWFENKYGPYIEKRGLNNWKNLFRKPTFLEWTILAMLLLAIGMFFGYQQDMALCQGIMKSPCEYCANSINLGFN